MLASGFSSASVIALGAVHGINPAMGWLFAVSLGLQAGTGRAVWRALAPLALGHALAIGAAVIAAALLGIVLPISWLRWLAAGVLLSFGAFHLLRHRHPRFGGMRVGARDLTIWSFLMASAHGAGLMVLPFVLGVTVQGAHAHAQQSTLSAGLLATMLHTASYLLVAGVLAWLVYWKVGVQVLRSAWINMNLIWAAALMIAGLVTPLL